MLFPCDCDRRLHILSALSVTIPLFLGPLKHVHISALVASSLSSSTSLQTSASNDQAPWSPISLFSAAPILLANGRYNMTLFPNPTTLSVAPLLAAPLRCLLKAPLLKQGSSAQRSSEDVLPNQRRPLTRSIQWQTKMVVNRRHQGLHVLISLFPLLRTSVLLLLFK